MNRSKLVCATVMLGILVSGAASAHEAGKWVLRAGVGVVDPKSDNFVETDGTDSVIVNVDSGTSLTLTGTYFFTQNWAFDILAAWPFKHDVNLTASDGTDTGTLKVAEVEHLPPTFSVQYHFLPDAQFQPFVGLGVNYTTFLSEDLTEEGALLFDSISLDDSFGLALQLGADWKLNDRWLINFDLRWIDIDSDLSATIDGTTAEVGTVEIDPLVYAINVGYAF